ncbi:TetR/AcrR family transcriptional regulator [Streptomyces sp. NPDC102467]|uniref:TetR/AcrR family transcriptional regulator n=1 Tax=Streptomyces sp. NPDC102467 TaxID=3366179 RepID=UPI0037F3468C
MDTERVERQARRHRTPGSPTPPAGSETPARGRPRSEAVEQAIVEGVVELLEKGVPLTELSIERIARTAGVGKATIYRRWSGKEELFVEVLRSMEAPDPELPGTSMRDDLVCLLEHLRRRGLSMRRSVLLHNVFAQMKTLPRLWDAYHEIVIDPRRRVMHEVLRRGVADGELPAGTDIELASDLVTGPMLLRSIMRDDQPLAEDLAAQIVDLALAGLRTGPDSRM